ncbi:MAG: hypothetical protein L0Z53_05630 [Acidobacteriales bacterium]|nr:hypothetical protein [Terriglobales bacterium]
MDHLIIRLVLMGLGAIFPSVYSAPSEWWRRLRSNGWPIVQGRIHSGQALCIEEIWSAELSYSYTVDGQYYSGYHKQFCASERDADDYLLQSPRDSAIFIRHHPAKPDRSVMRRDDQMGISVTALD